MLAAAGSGTRFESGENSGRKQFMELGGRPLITYSLDAFASISEVRVVCVVAPAEELEAVGELVRSWSKGCPRAAGEDLDLSLVPGGQSRQESVRLGVEAIGETCEWILVHDAARPLIEPGEYWVTPGDHADLGEAARIAAEQMVALMQERGGMDFATAYMLMSGAVDVQSCQCCEPGAFPVTTRAVVSKSLLAGSSTE